MVTDQPNSLDRMFNVVLIQFQIRSVLSIVPSKENDGSTYRCTVWNRALGQSRKFEASTDIFVNCEFKDNY